MVSVFFGVITIHEDVVKVRGIENVKVVKDHVIYITLEGPGGVTQAKWHNKVFKLPIARVKRYKPFFPLLNT
jgi:hypothetical protein